MNICFAPLTAAASTRRRDGRQQGAGGGVASGPRIPPGMRTGGAPRPGRHAYTTVGGIPWLQERSSGGLLLALASVGVRGGACPLPEPGVIELLAVGGIVAGVMAARSRRK